MRLTLNMSIVASLILGFLIGINYPKDKVQDKEKVTFIGYGYVHKLWSSNTYYGFLYTKDINEASKSLLKTNAKRFHDDAPQGKLVELYYMEVE